MVPGPKLLLSSNKTMIMNLQLDHLHDDQHLYLKSIFELLKDDIGTLMALKKKMLKHHYYLMKELIHSKMEMAKVLGFKEPINLDNDFTFKHFLKNSKFNIIDYLLTVEKEQQQVFYEILKSLNYSDEKQNLVYNLIQRNIYLLENFKD